MAWALHHQTLRPRSPRYGSDQRCAGPTSRLCGEGNLPRPAHRARGRSCRERVRRRTRTSAPCYPECRGTNRFYPQGVGAWNLKLRHRSELGGSAERPVGLRSIHPYALTHPSTHRHRTYGVDHPQRRRCAGLPAGRPSDFRATSHASWCRRGLTPDTGPHANLTRYRLRVR